MTKSLIFGMDAERRGIPEKPGIRFEPQIICWKISDRGSHVVERHGQGVYAEHVALVYTAKVGFENIHPVHKHVIFGGYERNESFMSQLYTYIHVKQMFLV